MPVLSPWACTTIVAPIFSAFCKNAGLPSRSVTTMSGLTLFSIRNWTAPSAAIFTNFLYIKKNKKFVKIAADGAVQFLIENKVRPDIVVTDLDGNPAFLQKAEKMGATMVVHAHGDNTGMLKKLVPKFKKLVGTTQVMPVENVYNFGGFTDGDRCV